MSIVHRITGCALAAGTVLIACWLMASASGPGAYSTAQWLAGSWFGQLALLGYTWALLHHMLGGIRHFIWDTGAGLERDTRLLLAKGTLVGSVIGTVLIWIVALLMR